MTPGASVRIVSACSLDGRTGVVTGVSPWAGLGWLAVELDPAEGKASSAIVPAAELEACERVGQLGLFGVGP